MTRIWAALECLMRHDDIWQRKEPSFIGTPHVEAFRRPKASRQDKLWTVLTWVSLAFLLYKGFVWIESWQEARSAKFRSQPDETATQAPPILDSTPSTPSPMARAAPSPSAALPAANQTGIRSVTKCVLGGSVSFTDGDCPLGAKRSAISVDVSLVGTVDPVLSNTEPPVDALRSPIHQQHPKTPSNAMRAPNKSEIKTAECSFLKLRIEQIDAATRQLLTLQQQDMYRAERRQVRQREADLGC